MILCAKREIARYKRRAKKVFPLEYLELLFGTVQGRQINIERLIEVPQSATKFYVNWLSDDETQDLIAETEAATGLDFIGTIHSHTLNHREAHMPSVLDNDSSHAWDERVFAIDHIVKRRQRFRHSVSFYATQQPLEGVAYF